VRDGAHPLLHLGAERSQVGRQRPDLIEQLAAFVAAHPALKLLDVPRMLVVDEQWHLVRRANVLSATRMCSC
jgi:hypothetical protein